MIIAFDLDEILAHFTLAMFAFHNEKYATNFTLDDMTSFFFEDICGGTQEEAIKKIYEFFETDHFLNMAPIIEAQETVEKLKDKGHTLYVVTGRQSVVEKQTKEWLKRHFPNTFSGVFLTNHFGFEGKKYRKSDFCSMIKADVFIDDHVDYAIECAECVPHVLLFDYPYNRQKLPKNVKRVHTWKEVEEEIEKIVVSRK